MEIEDYENATIGESSCSSLRELLRGSSSNSHLQHRTLTFILSFSNITYSVNLPKKMTFLNCFEVDHKETARKTILNDISGEARDGEILAVLGPSGSGKSTLIDALANRIEKESLQGSITLNGEVVDSRLMKAISAYVMQDDLLFPMLTVEETLMFAAEFKLPSSLSKAKKRARVEAMIDQLGLRDAAKTFIGDEGHRGVSGGERRRVSIGIEIVHDPIILFLDEPTSGLDSTSAFMVVKVLKGIARSGSIVMMSIHQPGYRIDGLFDKVLFLSQGNVVYSGPPSKLPGFFAQFGRPISLDENQTEFTLDLIHELQDFSEPPGETGITRLVDFNKYWQSMKKKSSRKLDFSPLLFSPEDAIKTSISKGKLVSESESASGTPASFSNPISTEILVLSARSMKNSTRAINVLLTRLGSILLTGFIVSTAYWQLDDSPKGVQERFGFFVYTVATSFYICAVSVAEFIQERYIFMRETASNTYRPSSYVISHSILTLPALAFLAFVFSAISFWPVGLAGGLNGFLFFFYITFASSWSSCSFVTFLSGVLPDINSGYKIAVTLLDINYVFMGYFVNPDRMPSYWIWFHDISLMKCSYDAVLINEFDNPSKCFGRGSQIFDNTILEGVPSAGKIDLLKMLSSSIGVNMTEASCITTGENVLRQNGIHGMSKWNYLWITVAWGFFYRILFYITLLIRSKNKRK